MTIALRPVTFSDELFAPLLAEAQEGGGTFLLRVREEWVTGVLRFDSPGELLLGAFDGEQLIGVGGISLDPYISDPRLGRIRHIYVRQARRREGVGRTIMLALIAHARRHFDILRLRTRTEGAAALYESLGFAATNAAEETHRMDLATSSWPNAPLPKAS